ncbi:MAG: hypothetical protein RLY16_2969 [Bacteroidota bacterium]
METNAIVLADLEQIVAADLPWQQFYNKTVLVTGANGFLPAYMVKTLLWLNHKQNANIKVIGLVRNIEKAKLKFKDYLQDAHLELWHTNIDAPLSHPDNIDFIIHAASQASPKYYGVDPIGTLSANVLGTYHLLELAATKKVERFLYFSSSEVYGALAASDSIAESSYGAIDPTQVRSCYAESKRMGETLCVSFMAQKQVPVVMARPFHTYGPGLSLDDGRVFADFVANIIKREDIVMNSDGSAVRSFCYLADATIGFFTVLLNGKAGEAYNVGNPAGAISIKELATLLVNLYPQLNLKAVFKTVDPSQYLTSTFNKLCPDISKINALGWEPTTSVADGFKKTIDSFY